MRPAIFILTLLFLCSCRNEKHETRENEAISSTEIRYAKHFRIVDLGKSVSIELFDPETGKREKTVRVTGKSYSIISLSATTNGMLCILNETERLVGVSALDQVYDERIHKSKVSSFGDETNTSLEKIIASKANLILYSGFGDEFPNQQKLERLGITVIPIYDWRETDPLGKAEWIKLIGALTGKLKEATDYFNDVEEQYNALKQQVKSYAYHPSVLSGNLIGDSWYAPKGDSYVAKIINDAGGKYIYAETQGTGSQGYSMEEILHKNRSTAIWLNPGFGSKRELLEINPHAKHLKAYDRIYCYSGRMNKFWERSAAEPHLVLSDLIHIFNPKLDTGYRFHFYSTVD